jgi:hypothetical protein
VVTFFVISTTEDASIIGREFVLTDTRSWMTIIPTKSIKPNAIKDLDSSVISRRRRPLYNA